MNRPRWIRLFAIITAMLLMAALSLATASSQSPEAPSASPFGPDGSVRALTGPSQDDALDIALGYLRANRGLWGLEEGDLSDLVITGRYTSSHNGVTHIYLRQRYDGLEVYGADINVNVAADGSIINVGNRAIAGLAKAVNDTNPTLPAAEAIRSASRTLGLNLTASLAIQSAPGGRAQAVVFDRAGISLEPITVKLMYQPTADGAVRLAWDLSIYELDGRNWWSMRMDARTGAELDRANFVDHDNFGAPAQTAKAGLTPAAAPSFLALIGDQYNVYAEPVESPSHGGRIVVTDPADPTASQFGWHDTNGAAGAEYTYTRGNNVHAYLDTDNNNSSDVLGQPDGGPSLHFDFPIDLGQQPSTYQDAAVTNLFYWNNLVHDVLYHYGFDEASGNFQENNYGNGGAGSDSVNAEAQDGGGLNNANFATPSDGANPRMQMYLWNTASPQRDGDLDNGIIVHEYGHGVSNRLTGGPNNVSCLNNTEQMGEGWSDYLTLIFTIESGDTGADRRGIGTYALNEPTTGTGIRDYPYSTDMAIDPRTYDAIKTAAVPHGVGSTWAAMLWEVTWGLIDQYGFDPDLYSGTGGNNIALQLVMDGMKLQTCSPGFVDGRDAILLADQTDNGGANQCIIWEAFAKRGLGLSADQGSSGSRSDGTEAFDLPPACLQTLKITKSASPSPVEAGTNLTYSLLVENDTTGTLTNVNILDDVPAGTTYVAGSASPPACNGSHSGGSVTFALGTMNSGASQTCTFQVTVSGGLGTVVFFEDDMEAGSGNWSATHGSGSIDWNLGTANPNSPTHAWFAQDISSITDQYLAMSSSVPLSGSPVLRFWHNYITEANFDGGVVEISANGGAWTDLGPSMTQNGYNSTISTSYGSPIGGRQAFSGSSGGYLETLVDLSSYTGDSVRIRFRMATDNSVSSTGWYVDDVEIVDEASVTNEACVSANEGDYACDTVVTLVTPGSGNSPPTFTSDPIIEVDATEDSPYGGTIADDATDPDLDPLTFSKISSTPAWLIVGTDGSLSGTPTNDDVGTNSWTVQVSDGNSGTDQATLQINVINTNDPPTFNSDLIVEANATEGQAYSGTIGDEATDPDLDPLTFSKISSTPAWLIVGTDGSLSGTPTNDDVGTNSWTVQVSDGNGGVDKATLEITVEAAGATVQQFADSDIPVAGTLSGDYLDTHADDGIFESLTERESGGRPANRHDFGEHTWTFQVQSGSQHTFFVNAWKTDSPLDGDDWTFAYSANGSDYADLVTVTDLTDGTTMTATIPANVFGTITIRATDTNQSKGNNNQLDTLFVDFMMIETVSGPPPPSIVMHSGGLTGDSTPGRRNNRWDAVVTITVHDADDNPVLGATVFGSWSNGANGSDTCVTDASGQCSISKANIKDSEPSVTFTLDDITRPGDTYSPGANHDPAGNPPSIVVNQPAP